MIRNPTHKLLLATCMLVLAGCLAGESADAPSDGSAASVSRTLDSGTRIDATLNQTISSNTADAGDAFTAEVVRDVTTAGGTSVIPAGSTIHGTITQVSPAGSTVEEGTLTLAITSVTVDQTMHQLDAAIESFATVYEERGIEKADVARVAGGAAAGAILGRVIGGNTQGTIIGGAVGAVAGAAVSVSVKDVDITLPAGAHLVLTLQSPFTP